MTTDTKHRRQDSGRLGVLLFGILAGPFAWAIHLMASYVLVAFVCGREWEIVLHLITLMTAAITAVAGWLAWRQWQGLRTQEEQAAQHSLRRRRFMALFGVLNSALFVFVIMAEGIPVFFLSTCS